MKMDHLEDSLAGVILAAFQGDVDSCLRAVEEFDRDGRDVEAALGSLARLSSRLMALAVRREAPGDDAEAALWVAARYVGAGFADRCSTAFREAAGRVRLGVPAVLELEGTIVQLAVRRVIGAGGRDGGEPAYVTGAESQLALAAEGRPRSACDQEVPRPPAVLPRRLPVQGEGGRLEERIHKVWPAVIDDLRRVGGKGWLEIMLAHPRCVMGVEPNSVLRMSVPEGFMHRFQTDASASDVLMRAFVRAAGEPVWLKLEPRDPDATNPPGTITGASLMSR